MGEVLTTENVVTLTAHAVGEVKSLLTLPENAGKHMRFYVEQGGCSGMQYGMIFDEKRDGDIVSDHDGVTVLVDPISAGHLRGSVVDFNDSLNDGGFKIRNPNAVKAAAAANLLRPDGAGVPQA